jgi:uncharacterized caspase-like protein
VTGAYSSLLAAAGVDVSRDALLRALRSSDDAAVERLAEPLLDAFCVDDVESLGRQRRELARAGVTEMVLVAPARRTHPEVTERYERAIAMMVGR